MCIYIYMYVCIYIYICMYALNMYIYIYLHVYCIIYILYKCIWYTSPSKNGDYLFVFTVEGFSAILFCGKEFGH